MRKIIAILVCLAPSAGFACDLADLDCGGMTPAEAQQWADFYHADGQNAPLDSMSPPGWSTMGQPVDCPIGYTCYRNQ